MAEDYSATLKKGALVAAAGLGMFALNYIRHARDPLRHKRIEIIQNVEDCQRIVDELKSDCQTMKVLGFDCEWVTVGGTRRPIALLQLSSIQGLCALFRLCCMKQIPKCLRDLLEDDEVLKVGVDPHGDAKKLSFDYRVGVASTYDLRYLATANGRKPEGLARMSKSVLHVHLDKSLHLVCSDWEAKELTQQQLHYAANDALVAVEIFKKLIQDLEPKNFWQFSEAANFDVIRRSQIDPFLEISFNNGYITNVENINRKGSSGPPAQKDTQQLPKINKRSFSARKKALYDNCLLEAPDGELLCKIDRKKAEWYIHKDLGIEIESDPYTVRLNFEPAGRAEGQVGKFYQSHKENQCVVCGHKEACIRKNVVPREYRKHFPVVMKGHSSHDVLLLCLPCHKISNKSDWHIRHKLSQMCNAPFNQEENALKYKQRRDLRKVRSTARSLLKCSDKISDERKTEMQTCLLKYYKDVSEISDSLLQEAAEMETKIANDSYSNHGRNVVQVFQTELGGLVRLEKIWREHFLRTMQPKFLPLLWDINHNANRLEVRASEGRVDPADLKLAGLEF